MKTSLFVALVLFGLIASGCAGKRINFEPKPDDPLFAEKNEFYDRYFRFVTENEKKIGYPELGIRPFGEIDDSEELNKFINNFWKIRDTDPNTPENEFKVNIDQRIRDIQNEALFSYGVNFGANGGLRGDMAHVYLFYGLPNCSDCIQKLSQSGTHNDLMVWYYFDQFGRARFRFLFYEKYGPMRVFKNYMPIPRFEDLFNPLMSPLKEISNRPAPSPQDLYDLWFELERDDPQHVFRAALLEFSIYSDVVIEGGNGKNRFGALDSPEPVSLTAARYRPTVIGQPEDLTKLEFVNGRFKSFIPALFRIGVYTNVSPYAYALFKYGDLDWEIKSDKDAECLLLLRISFQNKDTKEIKEFLSGVILSLNKDYLDKNNLTAKEFIQKNKNSYLPPVMFAQLINHATSSQGTLADLLKGLEPGTYVVNVDLRHEVTKKSAGGWREEVIVK